MRRAGPASITAIAATAAIAAWLPFLRSIVMPDEAGFLILAEQWQPGSSLYGDYWVDRPPLLIAMYWLIEPFVTIGHSGDGATAPVIKLLGATMSALTVILAAILAREVAPGVRWAAITAPVLALAFVSSPLLGMPTSNGELLALPFVMGGLILLVRALGDPPRRAATWLAAGAGASAMAAAMVKQNVIDVFVFALVAFIGMRSSGAAALRVTAAFAAGSLGMLAAIISVASARGTSPWELWHAVVTFRFHASALIGAELNEGRVERILILLAAFAGSGAAALIAASLWTFLRARPADGRRGTRLVAPTLAMTAWELLAVALGGSYWLHYLTGLVPGVLLLIMIAGSLRRSRILLTLCVTVAVVMNGALWAYRVADPPQGVEDAQAAAYLRQQASPEDGAIVGFGHPNVLLDAGLRSPYPYLWNLPVRVHDPELTHARWVLSGPDAPRWMIVHEDTPVYWTAAARSTRDFVQTNFEYHRAIGEWHVWERRSTPTEIEDPD